MIAYGYARVSRSTDDGGNTLENQRRRLNLAGVENHHIYEDIITGTVFRRPGLGALLSRLDASDTVVVTALDRLGRDTLGILELIHQLGTRKVELRILDTPVDTQDVEGGGRLVALVAAEIAQIEREKISRRTTAGLERARAEGKLTGRRWSISRNHMRGIHRMSLELGMTPTQISLAHGAGNRGRRRQLSLGADRTGPGPPAPGDTGEQGLAVPPHLVDGLVQE